MYPDGICRVTDTRYVKTLRFQDINYQLSQNEDKSAIFDGWCDFLNFFDSSVPFQLTFVNLSTTEENISRQIDIPLHGDEYDSIREEYTDMLRSQVAKGKNGLSKTKYLTFGVDADSLRLAKPRLERIEIDLINNFKRLGVTASALNGTEYLEVLHDIFNMLIVQDQVWNRVTINRAEHKTTRYYVDEFHLLLKEEQTASYSVEIWKRFRKWGGIPTGITQNVKDLLGSREIENVLENSDFIYMLNQASGDRQILAAKLNISPHQLSYVTHSGEGEGLLFYGNTIIPFVDHFPKDTELYRIMTTKPQEAAQ